MKHLIVSRVNVPRNLDPSVHMRPQPWRDPIWNDKRIDLLNKYTRSSLRKQTCQNFIFVTLWGDQHPIDQKRALPNEVQFLVKRGLDPNDELGFDYDSFYDGHPKKRQIDFYEQIVGLLKNFVKPPVLITSLDSDDCLRKDFVEVLQDFSRKNLHLAPVILDTPTRYCLNIKTGALGQKKRTNPSPFLSSLEIDKVEALALKYPHSLVQKLNRKLEVVKIKKLKVLQTVTDTNIMTQGVGTRDIQKINLKEYF